MYDQRGEQTISRSSILYGTSADDVWFNLDQFYKDQIQEVNQKLSQLDDEIWGKIVLMEKNKRVAKAYLRTPRFRVDGSCNAFDGQRIGFKSLNNAVRDAVVEEIREKIGVVLIKMDQQGNILAKRCDGSSPVIVQGWDRPESYCHGNDVTNIKGRLESEKPARVFDMRLFKAAVERELRQPYPDRKRLLYKSAVRLSLVKDEPHPFKTPCWFMIINLVALDMLNANVPPVFTNPSSSSASETPASPISRCQSVSSDLQLTGKHLSVSSNDLYFSPALLQVAPQRNADAFREASSPIWSETYEDLAATTSGGGGDANAASNSNADRLLSAQMANSLALGYGGYQSLNRPQRWSTSLARSMDCLYGTTANATSTPLASDSSLQNSRFSHPTPTNANRSHLNLERNDSIVETQTNQRRPPLEQRKTYAQIHHQRCTDSTTTTSTLASAVSDSESSSSGGGGGQQQEIYESSSTNSSNSSSGVSCRPSSPSVASETASESHHSADSVFTSESTLIYTKTGSNAIPAPVVPIAPVASRRGHTFSLASVAPEPPPRPQSLLKNAIRSKFGIILNSGNDTMLKSQQAALARYNNIRLDERDSSIVVGSYGVKQPSANNSVPCRNGRTTLFQKNSSNKNSKSRCTSDSDSEIYRL